MTVGAQVVGDLVVTGTVLQTTLTISTLVSGNLPQANLTQRDTQAFDIPLTDLLTDAEPPIRIGTASGAAFGLTRGTVGTASIQARTIDQKANGTVTSIYAIGQCRLPDNYVDGETVQVELICGMVTNIADTSATVDLEVWEEGTDGTVGADICATSPAQNMNSLTPSKKTFNITTTNLVAGDKLAFRITMAIRDNATGTAVIGAICRATLTCDVKG
jgi:hypothetical protein